MKDQLAENAQEEITEFLKDPKEEDQIPLIARLMQHSHNEYSAIMQQQVQWKDEEIARLKAKLGLIQNHVEFLMNGPYMPNTDYVRSALFPSDELVESYQKGEVHFPWSGDS